MGSFAVNLGNAQQKIKRTAAPKFKGNESVKIAQALDEGALLDILGIYQNMTQVKELVATLAGTPWCVTAGFHKGGIGGAAGAADQDLHITTSTGHHVKFDNKGRKLLEITGPGISLSPGKAAAAAASAPPSANDVELEKWYKLGLNRKQAIKAIQKSKGNNMTNVALAAKIKSGK